MGSASQFEIRLVKLEAQAARLVSDMESEKDTRARTSSELFLKLDKLDDRFRSIERKVWMGAGGLVALELILRLAGK